MSSDDKRKMAETVKSLSKDVHLEIFHFLKNNNENYTMNNNGVFFNLNDIKDDVLELLSKKIKFYDDNEKTLKTKYLERFNQD